MIRQAKVTDAPGIAQVHIKTWQAAYRGLLPDDLLDNLSLESRLTWWRGELGKPNPSNATFIAEEDGHAAGFATIGPSRDSDALAHTAELLSIYLLPEYWGKKLGLALLQAAAGAAAGRDFRDMTLWVLHDNERAIRFYRQAGFTADNGPAAAKVQQIGRTLIQEVRYRHTDLHHLSGGAS